LHSAIPALLELVRLDLQIADREGEMARLPGEREALAAERAQGEEGVAAAEAALQEAEQEQRRFEAEVSDGETLVARLEGQTHQVKTNEAYTALLGEIDAAKAKVSGAETAVLEAMEAIETAREALARARKAAAETGKRCDERARDCDDREKSADQSLANLQRQRESVVGDVDPALVARYEKIAARHSPAVAVVKRNSCGGCKVAIPVQRLIEMQKSEELITCGNCHRILVAEEAS